MAAERKTILLCVLNWGIGHAARCIPLIEQWLSENKQVVIASDGAALQMLRTEFPQLVFEKLPAYAVRYSKNANMVWAMALQLPKFLSVIKEEHKQLENLVLKYKPVLVVSDSRFGCHSKKIKSVFITHQLHLIMPEKWKWMEKMVNHFNHRQIAQFDECWVPDFEDENNLSGMLSHPPLPNTKYIGPLSRLPLCTSNTKKWEVLAILSGPEPQRTLLEEKLVQQMCGTDLNCLLVRGLPDGKSQLTLNKKNIIAVNYMNADALSQAIAESKLIICRSGYSTIMDLKKLQPTARLVFIPTPGQTEQEYLAEFCSKQGFCEMQKQDECNLSNLLGK